MLIYGFICPIKVDKTGFSEAINIAYSDKEIEAIASKLADKILADRDKPKKGKKRGDQKSPDSEGD